MWWVVVVVVDVVAAAAAVVLKEVSGRWFDSLHQFTKSNLFQISKRIFRRKETCWFGWKIDSSRKIRNDSFFYNFTARHNVYLVALSPIGILHYSFSMLVIPSSATRITSSSEHELVEEILPIKSLRENGKKLIRLCLAVASCF